MILAEMISGEIPRHATDETGQFYRLSQLPGPNLLEREPKRLLAKVFRSERIIGSSSNDDRHRSLVTAHQFLFRFAIPVADFSDQLTEFGAGRRILCRCYFHSPCKLNPAQ